MKIARRPTNECKGCADRDRIIQKFAETIDKLYEQLKKLRESATNVVKLTR